MEVLAARCRLAWMKHPREYPIYRPFEGECPPHLVESESDARIPLDQIRIMKDGDVVVAAYTFEKVTTDVYRILALRVIDSHSGRGIERWLLAHALGVIESKGGRCAELVAKTDCETFTALGFKRIDSDTLKLDLIPD